MLKTVTNYLNNLLFLFKHNYDDFGFHFSFSGLIIFIFLLMVFLVSLAVLLKHKSGFLLGSFLICLGIFGFDCHYNLQNNAKYHLAYKNTSMQVVNKIHRKYPYAIVTNDENSFTQKARIYLLRTKPHSTQLKRPIILYKNADIFSLADYGCNQPKYASVHEINHVQDSRKVLYVKNRNADPVQNFFNNGEN